MASTGTRTMIVVSVCAKISAEAKPNAPVNSATLSGAKCVPLMTTVLSIVVAAGVKPPSATAKERQTWTQVEARQFLADLQAIHPDTPGADYLFLPEGYTPQRVDYLIRAASGIGDPYGLALDVLTPGWRDG